MATLNAKVSNLALPTTSGGTSAATGYGFQPGLSVGIGSKQTGSVDALLAEYAVDLGFSVGTGTITQASISLTQNDAQNPPSSTFDFDNSKFWNIYNNGANAGTQNGACTISHDAGGVTLTCGTTTATEPDAAYEERILSIDSAAFANTKMGTITSALSTGNQATTGLGFKPDGVFFFLAGPTGGALPWAETQVDSNNPNGVMLGCTNGTNQWVLNTGVESEGGDLVVETGRYFLSTKCIAGWFFDQNADGAGHRLLEIEAGIVSLDADGFTVNFTTVDGSTNYQIGYQAFKMNAGYNFDCHTITSPTSTGAFSKTGLSFKPAALLGCHICKGASTDGTVDTDSKASFGVTDGVTSGCLSLYNQSLDAAGASVAKTYQDMSNFLSYRSGSGSTAAEAIAFTSFNSDGYTLNSGTAPATGSLIGIAAFGPGPSGLTIGEMDAACSTSTHIWVPGNLTRMIPSGSGGGRR